MNSLATALIITTVIYCLMAIGNLGLLVLMGIAWLILFIWNYLGGLL